MILILRELTKSFRERKDRQLRVSENIFPMLLVFRLKPKTMQRSMQITWLISFFFLQSAAWLDQGNYN